MFSESASGAEQGLWAVPSYLYKGGVLMVLF
jgi:hypothetical protein